MCIVQWIDVVNCYYHCSVRWRGNLKLEKAPPAGFRPVLQQLRRRREGRAKVLARVRATRSAASGRPPSARQPDRRFSSGKHSCELLECPSDSDDTSPAFNPLTYSRLLVAQISIQTTVCADELQVACENTFFTVNA